MFGFTQVEVPWALGPPDGRYLLRTPGTAPDAPPTHVLVVATLGAPKRRRVTGRRGRRRAPPQPAPTAVSTGRATVIDVGEPFASAEQAQTWLARAGEAELMGGLEVLGRALHAFRLASADPYLGPIGRRHALVARVGYGAGEQVADGLWTDARELIAKPARHRRKKLLEPQARLAALIAGHAQALACEELALRARLDLEQGRPREAALQALVALDAALAELARDPTAQLLDDRLVELRQRRDALAGAARAALAGPLSGEDRDAVKSTLARLEALLRARALANP